MGKVGWKNGRLGLNRLARGRPKTGKGMLLQREARSRQQDSFIRKHRNPTHEIGTRDEVYWKVAHLFNATTSSKK
eukprot:728023-Amphidinium_carterae.1